MKKIERMALDKAIATLEALGLKYKILLTDGKYHTNMTIDEDRAKSNKRSSIDMTPLYKEAIINMKVGDVAVIEVPENIAVERVRSTIAAQMHGRYGVGAHMSTVNGRKIEVLRLA